ncbi:hypothetical protein PHMEG_00017722 [Phytophthora megakarya]|uniref:GPI inositol-deacylase n=1 Tax=Phytophthora megakarya TaxID=4795 RepID=A0A225VXQ2_9STRA|nr:hypothetical protein PHMEG_00017722 [Phytophthora megakarya]
MWESLRSVLIIVFAFGILIADGAPQNVSTEEWLKNSVSKASSLRLHVKLTTKNMKIHGQSAFDVFANPVVSDDHTNVHYDGFTSFVEGDSTYSYMFVGGRSYMVESTTNGNTSKPVRCLPSVIPFEQILPALSNATAIPSARVGGKPIVCPSGSLFKTSFGSVDFVLCASNASGFTAYGLEVQLTAEFLPSPIRNTLLTFSDTSCPVVATPSQVTPTAVALLTGEPIPASMSRNLKEAFSIEIGEKPCECKSSPRPCIFLHGLGNPNERTELQNTPKLTKEKFGDIGAHAPCCTTTKYAVLNTNDYGWTSDTLQQKFCKFSLSMSKSSDLSSRTISNTIVVTHSMGGVVMAGALATGKCKFADSTTWVSLSAPMKGSMAGDYSQDLCDDEITSIGADLMDFIGQCPPTAARKSISYEGGKYSNKDLNAAYKAAQEAYRTNVDAAMCSTSYDGVYSKFYPSCIVGGKMIPHKSSENDGLVEFQSCLGGLDPELFGDSYESRFYKPELNHADTAFLTHDSLFSDSRKPFKWFECLL